MTGSSVIIEELVPEKNLEKKVRYKYFPDASTLRHMHEDFYRSIGQTPLVEDSTEFEITVIVRKYEKRTRIVISGMIIKPNDTKNIRI